MIRRFGNDYGGYHLRPDLIATEGCVIDCGVGTDTSFAEDLKRAFPKIRIVGVDPSEESETYSKGVYWKFIRAAIAPRGQDFVSLYTNRQPHHGSMTSVKSHRDANTERMVRFPAVSLVSLVAAYSPCVVKLDIEGSEFECIRECFGVPQIAMELHGGMIGEPGKTDKAVADLEAAGYEVAHRTEREEFLFVRRV